VQRVIGTPLKSFRLSSVYDEVNARQSNSEDLQDGWVGSLQRQRNLRSAGVFRASYGTEILLRVLFDAGDTLACETYEDGF
jgi:hypothetical protein